MTSREEVAYRLRLAAGFLSEARQDCGSTRWRSCVDNSQLAVENAAKALLAIFGPVGRTHRPAVFLREALTEGDFRTPWEIFGEDDGREALSIAEAAVLHAGLVAEGADRR